MSDARNVLDTLVGWASFKRNTLSMTEISVDVELIPTNALQSFTTQPAANTSLPRFTVPAFNGTNEKLCYHFQFYRLIDFHLSFAYRVLTTNGTCNNDDNSS